MNPTAALALNGDAVLAAAALVRSADALVIAAGAGMGVDSGLPDFRGDEGFWNAYPPFRHLSLKFTDLANPAWFRDDPPLAWGFYGHRLNLYRRTQPHAGFAILRRWAEATTVRPFVYTSNVDGQFQRAGFVENHLVECHGSIHRWQCVEDANGPIWDAGDTPVQVDEAAMRAVGELPRDSVSGRLARPNILMFGDCDWNSRVTDAQDRRYNEWLAALKGARLVVVEVGAGTAVPSVRRESERLVRRFRAQLIRINAREPEVPAGHIGLAGGALATLTAINQVL